MQQKCRALDARDRINAASGAEKYGRLVMSAGFRKCGIFRCLVDLLHGTAESDDRIAARLPVAGAVEPIVLSGVAPAAKELYRKAKLPFPGIKKRTHNTEIIVFGYFIVKAFRIRNVARPYADLF